jgi:hypothetical protein
MLNHDHAEECLSLSMIKHMHAACCDIGSFLEAAGTGSGAALP